MKTDDLQSALDRAFPEQDVKVLVSSMINEDRVIVRVHKKGLGKALSVPIDGSKLIGMTESDVDSFVADIRKTFDAGPDVPIAC